MYYRRKIALALIQKWGGEIGKLDFQKLLFLLNQKREKPCYDFVPYKFGCYSFQATADLHTLQKYAQIAEIHRGSGSKTDTWKKIDEVDYLGVLDSLDRLEIERLYQQFRDFDTHALIRHTYLHFPYYAIKSTIAHTVLTLQEQAIVAKAVPHSEENALYSIGYEGLSLEAFINLLLQYDIKLLCDVRKNSKSMKFGFSKNQLRHACTSVGIEFLHLPVLGIDSDQRQSLHSQADYDKLFESYRSTTLIQEYQGVKQLADNVEKYQRVAITCFEANIHQCHRKHLGEAVMAIPNWTRELIHICTK
jgi:Protein of unknown function, DUF488